MLRSLINLLVALLAFLNSIGGVFNLVSSVPGQPHASILVVVYSISGTITAGGLPLAGVSVTADSGGKLYTDTTLDNGAYILASLPAGSYHLAAAKPEFDCLPAARDFTLGSDLPGQDFTCTQSTYTISGAVTDKGLPLQGVTITDGAGSSTLTAADGSYQFTSLVAGDYTISASFAGSLFNPPSRQVHVGPGLSQVDFTVRYYAIYLAAVTFTPPDQVIFSDNFDLANPGWQAEFTPGGAGGAANGYYRLFHSGSGQFLAALAPVAVSQIPAAGYILQVNAALTQGSDARLGLLFDRSASADAWQILIISPATQHYWVYRYVNRLVVPAPIVSGFSAAINPGSGANNLIRLVRRPDTIQIFINGSLVADTVPDVYSSGRVGLQLSVYTSSPGEGHFDNFNVFKLP